MNSYLRLLLFLLSGTYCAAFVIFIDRCVFCCTVILVVVRQTLIQIKQVLCQHWKTLVKQGFTFSDRWIVTQCFDQSVTYRTFGRNRYAVTVTLCNHFGPPGTVLRQPPGLGDVSKYEIECWVTVAADSMTSVLRGRGFRNDCSSIRWLQWPLLCLYRYQRRQPSEVVARLSCVVGLNGAMTLQKCFKSGVWANRECFGWGYWQGSKFIVLNKPAHGLYYSYWNSQWLCAQNNELSVLPRFVIVIEAACDRALLFLSVPWSVRRRVYYFYDDAFAMTNG